MVYSDDQNTGESDLERCKREFREQGFLAPAIEQAQARITESHQRLLATCDHVNRLVQSIYLASTQLLPGKRPNERLPVIINIMPRVLASYQGSIILLRKGMIAEGLTLARSIYECLFWIGYLDKGGDDALLAFEFSSLVGDVGLYTAASKHDFRDTQYHDEIAKRRNDFIKRKATFNKKSMTLEDIAKSAGMESEYVVYKQLCSSAAHLSHSSIAGYLMSDENNVFCGHVIGPNEEAVPQSLGRVLGAMFLVMKTFCDATDLVSFLPRVNALADIYVKVMDGSYLAKANG